MTGPRPRLAVVGSSNVDLTFRTPRLPGPGETVAGRSFQTDFGGKGANQAVSAARVGAGVAFVSRVGRDVFGDQVLAHLRAQGIDTSHVGRDPGLATGVASIAVDDQARNCILVVPGANHGLTPGHVRGAAEALRAAQALLCQLEVPLETVLEAFRTARDAGVLTLLNPAPARDLPDELLHATDVCIPNETETETLTGRRLTTLESIEEAARVLLKRGPRTVIVTLGERGALIVTAGATEYVPTVPVRAVDPTGAGDAFAGSLAVFLARGIALPTAARRACAVAALSVTKAGAQSSFPSLAEVEAFLAEYGLGP